jgi:hypothetical protein
LKGVSLEFGEEDDARQPVGVGPSYIFKPDVVIGQTSQVVDAYRKLLRDDVREDFQSELVRK